MKSGGIVFTKPEVIELPAGKTVQFAKSVASRMVSDPPVPSFQHAMAPAKQKSVENILSWSRSSITDALAVGVNRKIAQKLFRNLQRAMDDRKLKQSQHKQARMIGSDPKLAMHVVVGWLVSQGMSEPLLQDELYLQVLKQIRGNPNNLSMLKGWEVLCVYASCLLPSKKLMAPLLEWLEDLDIKKVIVSESNIEAHGVKLALPASEQIVAVRKYQMATYVRSMIQKHDREGIVRLTPPSVLEVASYSEAPFKCPVFGVKLEEIMEDREHTDDTNLYPRVLVFLAESTLNLRGYAAEGIFRIPCDLEQMNSLRQRLVCGKYNLDGINDPHVPAVMLKQWLRELLDPLIPANQYQTALAAAYDPQAALLVLHQLPTHHRNALEYLILFLQVMGKPRHQLHTKMNFNSLATIFAPNIFRCPFEDPPVILACSKREQAFLRNLIDHFHV